AGDLAPELCRPDCRDVATRSCTDHHQVVTLGHALLLNGISENGDWLRVIEVPVPLFLRAIPYRARRSDFKEQPLGVLDALLDADEEAHRLAAIDDPVVVRERQVHHRPDHDLVVDGDRALLDRVHAEDAALGWVQDWRREERAEDAAVGDREGTALEV